MHGRRAWFIAAWLGALAAAPAHAQAPAAAPQQQQQAGQPPPCITEFLKLRDETQKRGLALKAASERHATPKEACGLFNSFTAVEAKLLKYASDNSVWCGIPQQIIDQIKQGHAKSVEMRTRVCQAAANNLPQGGPRVPTLSDALGAPVPDAGNIKTGRGTFDTLTGTPLGNNNK